MRALIAILLVLVLVSPMSNGQSQQNWDGVLAEVDRSDLEGQLRQRLISDIRQILRENRIGYSGLGRRNGTIVVRIINPEESDRAFDRLRTVERPAWLGDRGQNDTAQVEVRRQGDQFTFTFTKTGVQKLTEPTKDAIAPVAISSDMPFVGSWISADKSQRSCSDRRNVMSISKDGVRHAAGEFRSTRHFERLARIDRRGDYYELLDERGTLIFVLGNVTTTTMTLFTEDGGAYPFIRCRPAQRQQAQHTQGSGGQREAAASTRCKGAFKRSEAWLFSFEHLRCTDRNWSIARRAGRSRTQCAALHPGAQMIVVADRQAAPSVMLRDLPDERWLTTADQFADVRLAVDGQTLFEGLIQVEVVASPPLRYGLLWPLRDGDLEWLRRGNALHVAIGDGSWNISLGGSLVAIDQVRQCSVSATSR